MPGRSGVDVSIAASLLELREEYTRLTTPLIARLKRQP